jgi:hypothetical protein
VAVDATDHQDWEVECRTRIEDALGARCFSAKLVVEAHYSTAVNWYFEKQLCGSRHLMWERHWVRSFRGGGAGHSARCRRES